MKVVKYNHLTNENIDKFAAVLTEAFQKNDFIYTYLIGRSPKRLKKFLKMDVDYNNHFGDYYALVKDNGQWAAVALYLPNGCEPIGLKSALKRGKLVTVIRFFLSNPIKYTRRMIKFSDSEEKLWYKDSSVTLDILASLEKGCGKLLIEATIKNYNKENVVLNSSVTYNDHAYYKQLGFEIYDILKLDKYETAMMIKKA